MLELAMAWPAQINTVSVYVNNAVEALGEMSEIKAVLCTDDFTLHTSFLVNF